MSENKIDGHELITTPDGHTMRMDVLKAQTRSAILKKQRSTLANLPIALRSDFYYKTYQKLNQQTFEENKEPIMQMGLSPFTFMREPVTVGNFQTTYGDLFSRIHRALMETAGEFDLENNGGK